ncbi:MAG: hypothetical protein RBQ97_07905 [Acholeplasma sp.]|nr:hypothetical protein [Acholeplasma sp.]
MMKKYFKHHFKESLIPTFIMAGIGSIIYLGMIFTEGLKPRVNNQGDIYLESLSLQYFSVLLIALVIIIPIFQTNYLKDKKSADLYLSLPFKKNELLLTHLLIGFIQVVIVFTIVYWVGFVGVVINFASYSDVLDKIVSLYNISRSGYHYIYYVPLYFISLGVAIIPYIITSFVYLKANNKIDGIIMIIMYLLIPVLLLEIISQTFLIYEIDSMYYTSVSFIPFFVYKFNNLINQNQRYSYGINYNIFENILIPLLVYVVLTVVAVIIMFKDEKKRTAENIEGITESYYGYKVLLPVLISLIIIFSVMSSEMYIIGFIFGALSIFAFMIYKRTFKIPTKYYIIWVALIVGSLALSAVFIEIREALFLMNR